MNLEKLPKVGVKTINILKKLKIEKVEDLIYYYPYKYNIIKFVSITDANEDFTYYVKARIISEAKCYYIKRNFNKLDFYARNNNIDFKVVIFNRAFLKKNLIIDSEVVLVGKFNRIKNTFTASDIKFSLEEEKIEAVYHLTDGIKNSMMESIIDSALKENIEVIDYIPSKYNTKYNLISKDDALISIHKPSNISDIKSSKLKLIYEELFIYMFKINYLKSIKKEVNGIKKEFDEEVINEFLSSLNFELTTDQVNSIMDILKDMKSNKRMNRLVLGDVGSGKSIVAFVGVLANFLSGYQSAFMAPTEILAKQHYESMKEYFKFYNINIALLTGSMKHREKEKVYKEISEGVIDVVIGTHALLSEALIFGKLGLVVTDEQHRFGVNQRNNLQSKGLAGASDVLYLSATPIPRTYALTIYGDLDLSQIKTKPSIRKEVVTKVFTEDSIKEVLLKMLSELKMGHQIFVVSPLIMDNQENNLNSVNNLRDKMNIAFNGAVRIEILHGKLKQKEKDELMRDFQNKKIGILISTTVIEVGIDIPNASMMVIFNAERFGLATLHQLRGRVGRSDIESFCYLVSNTKNNDRLRVMEKSSDGFFIAEADFKQRGEGDLFGVKQSGDTSFKIANLNRDYEILMQASRDSQEYLDSGEYMYSQYYKKIIEEISFLD